MSFSFHNQSDFSYKRITEKERKYYNKPATQDRKGLYGGDMYDSIQHQPRTAMLSISTSAPLGSCFTAKAERAGKAPLK